MPQEVDGVMVPNSFIEIEYRLIALHKMFDMVLAKLAPGTLTEDEITRARAEAHAELKAKYPQIDFEQMEP